MHPTRNNRGKSHENGAIESSPGHFKRRLHQALLLRGSKDLETVSSYPSPKKQNQSQRVRRTEESNQSRESEIFWSGFERVALDIFVRNNQLLDRHKPHLWSKADGETTKLDHTLYAFHSFKTSKIKWQFIDSSSH